MKLSNEQISRLITIVISTVLAVLAVFGYDVAVVQPRIAAVAETAGVAVDSPAGVIGTRSAGVLADRYFEALAIGKTLKNSGTLTQTGAASFGGTVGVTGATTLAGNLAANGGISVDSSNFTVNGGSGAVSTASTLAVAGAAQFSGDVSLPDDATGGNAGNRNSISGLYEMRVLAFGTMTNGTTETTSYTDDSSAGEFAPIDADVTEAEGSTDSIYRVGSSSYKAIFAATAAEGDGFKRTITGDDLEANEYIGMWLYPTAAVVSGDLQVLLTDNGGARTFPIAAGVPANQWTWVRVDISSLNAGTGDTITEFGITLTAQGATNLGAFNLYLDGAWKWDTTDEESLGATAIVEDGVLGVMTAPTLAASANTQAMLTENTDFFVDYAGNKAVMITDQSANSGVAFVAY